MDYILFLLLYICIEIYTILLYQIRQLANHKDCTNNDTNHRLALQTVRLFWTQANTTKHTIRVDEHNKIAYKNNTKNQSISSCEIAVVSLSLSLNRVGF